MFLISRLHKWPHCMKFKQIYIFYSNLHRKTCIRFFKNKFSHKFLHKSYTNSYTNSYANPLWREIDDITYYFLVSSINLKAVYLGFHCFSDSWTRGFELATRRLELVTRRLELVTRGLELVTGGFELVTRGFELVTRGFELVTLGFEHVIRGFELVTRWLNS